MEYEPVGRETSVLIGKYSNHINFGDVDYAPAVKMLDDYSDNKDFLRCAKVARHIRKSLDGMNI